MTDMSATAEHGDWDGLAAARAEARQRAEADDLTGARKLLEEAVARGELRLGRDDPRLVPLIVDLSSIAQEVGNLTEAQTQISRAYAIVISSSGPDHPFALSVEGRLASITYRLGDPTDLLDRHLVDMGGEVLGATHTIVSAARDRLAVPNPGLSVMPSPPFPPLTEPPTRQVTAAPAAPPVPFAPAPSPPSDQFAPAHAASPDQFAPAHPAPPEPFASAPDVASPYYLDPYAAPAADLIDEAPWPAPAPPEQSPYGVPPYPSLPEPVVSEPAQGSAYVPSPYAAGVYDRQPSSAPPAPPTRTYQDVEVWREPATRSAGPRVAPAQAVPPRPSTRGSVRTDSDRLPVPRRGVERRVVRRTGGGAVLLVSLAVVALVVGLIVAYQFGGPSNRSAGTGAGPTAAGTSAPPSGPPLAAPGNVTIADHGGSVTLTWADLSGGRTPFIVAGGRTDAPSQPFETVPAGRTTSTIYGLNDRYDYCFTVTAIYSTTATAPSPRVCTHRLSTKRAS
jgi:hypothetical protein